MNDSAQQDLQDQETVSLIVDPVDIESAAATGSEGFAQQLSQELPQKAAPQANRDSTLIDAPLSRRAMAATIDGAMFASELACVAFGTFVIEVGSWKYAIEPLMAVSGKIPVLSYLQFCYLMIPPMISVVVYSILMLATGRTLLSDTPYATLGKRLCGLAAIYDDSSTFRSEGGFSIFKGLGLVCLLLLAASFVPGFPWGGWLFAVDLTFWIPLISLMYLLRKDGRTVLDKKLGRRVVCHPKAQLDRSIASNFATALLSVGVVVYCGVSYDIVIPSMCAGSRYDLPCEKNSTTGAVAVNRDLNPGETLTPSDLQYVSLGPWRTPSYSVPSITAAVGKKYWLGLKRGELLAQPFLAKSAHLSSAIAHFGWGDYETAMQQAKIAVEKDPDNPEGYRVRAQIYDYLAQKERSRVQEKEQANEQNKEQAATQAEDNDQAYQGYRDLKQAAAQDREKYRALQAAP